MIQESNRQIANQMPTYQFGNILNASLGNSDSMFKGLDSLPYIQRIANEQPVPMEDHLINSAKDVPASNPLQNVVPTEPNPDAAFTNPNVGGTGLGWFDDAIDAAIGAAVGSGVAPSIAGINSQTKPNPLFSPTAIMQDATVRLGLLSVALIILAFGLYALVAKPAIGIVKEVKSTVA